MGVAMFDSRRALEDLLENLGILKATFEARIRTNQTSECIAAIPNGIQLYGSNPLTRLSSDSPRQDSASSATITFVINLNAL